jgi:hypothetical protein
LFLAQSRENKERPIFCEQKVAKKNFVNLGRAGFGATGPS